MPLIPALIDFTPGTTMVSSQVDANFAAIRTPFNDTAVLTDVVKTITVGHLYSAAQFFASGTAGNPGISFASDPDCGLYRVAADTLGLAVAGVQRWDFAVAGSALTGNLTINGVTVLSDTAGNNLYLNSSVAGVGPIARWVRSAATAYGWQLRLAVDGTFQFVDETRGAIAMTIGPTGTTTLLGNIVYGVADGGDWDIRPPIQFGFGLRLRPNGSAGGVANRRFEIGHWDNVGTYTGVVRVDETGALTMLVGGIVTKASASGAAGLNVPHGAAPSAPVNGDLWTTTAGMFVRINGVTKTVTLT